MGYCSDAVSLNDPTHEAIMKKLLILFGCAVIGTQSVASSQVQPVRDVISQCEEAISKSDRVEAAIIAERLSKMASMAKATNLLNEELVSLLSSTSAEMCQSYARQIKLEFSPLLGKYLSSRVRQQAEQQQLEDERALEVAQQQQEAESKQRLLEATVNARVLEACNKLYRQDKVAAFTNELCVKSFKAYGLPAD